MPKRIQYPEGTVRTRDAILDGAVIRKMTDGRTCVFLTCSHCGGAGSYPSSCTPAGMCNRYCWMKRSEATYGRMPYEIEKYVKKQQAADRMMYREALKFEAERPAREAAAKEATERAERQAAEKAERDAAVRAEKAKRQYVGTIGSRLALTLTSEAIIYIEGAGGFGWQAQGRYVLKFRDADGNALVCFTSDKPGNWIDGQFETFDEGDRIEIKATVKAHESYKDEAQTVIQRIKLLAVTTTASV